MNPDGSDKKQITKSERLRWRCGLFADGKTIVFLSDKDAKSLYESNIFHGGMEAGECARATEAQRPAATIAVLLK